MTGCWNTKLLPRTVLHFGSTAFHLQAPLLTQHWHILPTFFATLNWANNIQQRCCWNAVVAARNFHFFTFFFFFPLRLLNLVFSSLVLLQTLPFLLYSVAPGNNLGFHHSSPPPPRFSHLILQTHLLGQVSDLSKTILPLFLVKNPLISCKALLPRAIPVFRDSQL